MLTIYRCNDHTKRNLRKKGLYHKLIKKEKKNAKDTIHTQSTQSNNTKVVSLYLHCMRQEDHSANPSIPSKYALMPSFTFRWNRILIE